MHDLHWIHKAQMPLSFYLPDEQVSNTPLNPNMQADIDPLKPLHVRTLKSDISNHEQYKGNFIERRYSRHLCTQVFFLTKCGQASISEMIRYEVKIHS